MGPSAFRIAGLGDRISELGYTVSDHGRSALADSGNAKGRRSDEEIHQRDRAGLPQPVRRGAAVARFGRAAAGARRRSQPRRGLGGRERRLRSARDVVPARPDLGGRAWRHEHAADDHHRERTRDAAGGAARTGASGACVDWIVAVGVAATHRAARHSQPRREREGQDSRGRRARLHDERHRPRRHRDDRRTRHRAGLEGHRRHPRLIRSRRLRSDASPRGSARRSRADSTTARRTW